jgi:hypothetical protein
MTKRQVYIDDYSWFDVSLDEKGEVTQVIESRVVWPTRDLPNKLMSERIRRAIEVAKRDN